MQNYIYSGLFSLAAMLASTSIVHAASCSEANGLHVSEQDGNIATFAQQAFSVTLKPGESMTLKIIRLATPSQYNIQVDGTSAPAGVTVTNGEASDRTYSIQVFVHEALFSITTNCNATTPTTPTPTTPTPTTPQSPPSSHKVSRDAQENVAEAFWGVINAPIADGKKSGLPNSSSSGLDDPDANLQNGSPHLNEGEEILFWPRATNSNRISGAIDILNAYANAGRTPDALTPGSAPVDPDWSLRMRFDAAFVDSHADNAESWFGTLGLSAGYRVNDTIAVGGHLMLGTRDSKSTALNTTVKGTDIGVGSNMSVRMGDSTYLNVAGFYINGSNRAATGTVADRYTTHQFGGGATLSSIIELTDIDPDLLMTTSGSIRYTGLKRNASTDSSGAAIAAIRTDKATASLGVTLSKSFVLDDQFFNLATLSGGTALSASTTHERFSTSTDNYSTFSASVSGGIGLQADNGVRLDFHGGISGLGGRATTFIGGGRLSIPLP